MSAAATVHKIMGLVEVNGSGCWIYTGSKRAHGYGSVLVSGRSRPAHRALWEALHGPVPDGLELDHLCRVPACVNPEHLEPVTHRENCLRGVSPIAKNAAKTHCIRGHRLEGDNLRSTSRGRICKTCENEARLAKAHAARTYNRSCEYCFAEFFAGPQSQTQRFCSKECRTLAYKKRRADAAIKAYADGK